MVEILPLREKVPSDVSKNKLVHKNAVTKAQYGSCSLREVMDWKS